MDCKKADDLLIDFLYGELSSPDREAFEQHLTQCPVHAREVEKAKGVLKVVREDQRDDLPAEVSERILRTARAAIPERPRSSLWLPLRWNPVAAAAILVGVMITVGIAVIQIGEEAGQEQTSETTVMAPAQESKEKARVMTAKPRPVAADDYEAREPKPRSVRPAATPRDSVLDFAPAPKDKAEPAPRRPGKARKKKARSRRRKFSVAVEKETKPAVGGVAAAVSKADQASTGAGTDDAVTGTRGSARMPAAPSANGDEGAGGPSVDLKREDRPRDKQAERAERRFAKPPPDTRSPRPVAPSARPAPKKAPAPEPALSAAPPAEEEAMEADMALAEAVEAAPSRTAKARVEKKKALDPYQAAELDMAGKRYAQAAVKYQDFISTYPGDPRIPTSRFRFAKALFLAGDCRRAVDAIDRAVRAAPRHAMAPSALLDQASCHVSLGQFERAAGVYRRLERDFPSYSDDARRGIERIERGRAVPASEPTP